MPSLILKKLSKFQDRALEPIALVKAEDKNHELHNSFLYLDKSDDPKIGKKEIILPLDCRFELIPSAKPRDRFIWYICGPSGVGKSYLAKQIAINYLKLFPDRKIYLVSKLDHDDTIDKIGENLFRLDYKNFIFEPPNISELKNSLVIFDDVDSIEQPHFKEIHRFADDIATMGRSHSESQGGVSLIYITHAITNYKITRLLLLESHFKIVFPNATNAHSLNYILKKYVGLTKNQVKDLKQIAGRFACLHTFYPNYLLTKYSAKLLHTK